MVVAGTLKSPLDKLAKKNLLSCSPASYTKLTAGISAQQRSTKFGHISCSSRKDFIFPDQTLSVVTYPVQGHMVGYDKHLFIIYCCAYSQLLNIGARRPPPRKIIMNLSVNDDVQLKKSENAWKPGLKRESAADDPEMRKTQVGAHLYTNIHTRKEADSS